MDPGIIPAVAALRACGIPTQMSCEGHDDGGTPWPWVMIHSDNAELASQWDATTGRPGRREAEPHYERCHQLLAELYDHGRSIPADEIFLTILPLGASGVLQVLPSYAGPGGAAVRLLRQLVPSSSWAVLRTRGLAEFDRLAKFVARGAH
jgi:hypothetical protein